MNVAFLNRKLKLEDLSEKGKEGAKALIEMRQEIEDQTHSCLLGEQICEPANIEITMKERNLYPGCGVQDIKVYVWGILVESLILRYEWGHSPDFKVFEDWKTANAGRLEFVRTLLNKKNQRWDFFYIHEAKVIKAIPIRAEHLPKSRQIQVKRAYDRLSRKWNKTAEAKKIKADEDEKEVMRNKRLLELDKMNLVKLKACAEELGITKPNGHKGHKQSWLNAIKKIEAKPKPWRDCVVEIDANGIPNGYENHWDMDVFIGTLSSDAIKKATPFMRNRWHHVMERRIQFAY